MQPVASLRHLIVHTHFVASAHQQTQAVRSATMEPLVQPPAYTPFSLKGKVALITGECATRIASRRPGSAAAAAAAAAAACHSSQCTPACLPVPGASAGIGEACAWRFAEAGCKLVLIARREGRLAALAEHIRRAYPEAAVHTISMDVRDLEAVARLPQELPEEFQVGWGTGRVQRRLSADSAAGAGEGRVLPPPRRSLLTLPPRSPPLAAPPPTPSSTRTCTCCCPTRGWRWARSPSTSWTWRMRSA